MSSLFRNPAFRPLRALSIACLACTANGAFAADGYFIPELTLGGEHHTNLDLNPTETPNGPKQDVSGYSALAGAILGWRTPRNVTEMRPRAQFFDYPDRDELRRTNHSLDLSSRYGSLRSEWELVGSYSKQTTYEAQRTSAQFDEFDPDDPIVDSVSRTSLVAETRTRTQVRPSYTYKFSQRIGAEIEAVYQTEDFGGGSSNVDYDYYFASGSLLWSMGPKTQLGTGLYGSKYSGADADEITAKGITVGVLHNWSQTLVGNATINFEETTAKAAVLAEEDTSNNWGIDLGLVKRGQISNIRFNAGRTFNPSGIGSRTVTDQIRVQYFRNLTQRWTFLGAVRAVRSREQGFQDQTGENRDFVSAYTQLGWNVTRTWSVNGGYSYYWRKYQTDGNHGDDHVVTLGIAYRGLRPQ